MDNRQVNRVATLVMAASSEVMREMGFGLHPEIYKFCLYHELIAREIEVVMDYRIPVFYKRNPININLSIHLVVEDSLLVNIFSQSQMLSQDEIMMKSALVLSKQPMGLLLNFHSQNFINSYKKITNSIYIPKNDAI